MFAIQIRIMSGSKIGRKSNPARIKDAEISDFFQQLKKIPLENLEFTKAKHSLLEVTFLRRFHVGRRISR